MTIETFTTPEKQKERIIEYIGVMQDEIVPFCIRQEYTHRCEVILRHYTGSDYDDLWNVYLIARAGMVEI